MSDYKISDGEGFAEKYKCNQVGNLCSVKTDGNSEVNIPKEAEFYAWITAGLIGFYAGIEKNPGKFKRFPEGASKLLVSTNSQKFARKIYFRYA